MSAGIQQRVLPLAGLVQALQQVRRIADTGQADETVLRTTLDSVFRVDAPSVQAVYGETDALRPGLQAVARYFRNEARDELLPRLVLAVLQLERRLMADADMATRVHEGIVHLASEAGELGSTHPQVLARLVTLYSDTVSHLRPRVMVQGNPHYLGQAGIVSEIRAVLLGAVRSAVLWRQLGGSQWDFLLRRRAMCDGIDALLG